MKKILGIIFCLSLVVATVGMRFYHLGSQPPGLHIDEVSFGADARSIAETGRDTWNTAYPLTFRAFGEWKAPGLVYSMAIFSKLLGGMSTTVTRLPSAVAGLVTLLSLWGIMSLIWKEGKVYQKFLVLTVVAFSPWHFDMSRIFYEAFSALAWLSLTLFTLTYILVGKKRELKWWVLAAIFASLSGYWYASTRYIAFGLLAVAVLVSRGSVSYKARLLAITLLTCVVIGFGWVGELVSAKGLNRLKFYQQKNEQGAVLQIDEKRQYCYLNFGENAQYAKVCYLFWNKPVATLERMATTATNYLSAEHLFIHSASEYGVDNNYGFFLFPLIPLYAIGLLIVLSSSLRGDPYSLFLVLALAVSLIPASLAGDVTARMGVVTFYLLTVIMIMGLKASLLWGRVHFPRLIPVVSLSYLAIIAFYILQSQLHYFAVFTRSNDTVWTSETAGIYAYVGEHAGEYDRIVDMQLHGPIAAYFYGLTSTEAVQQRGKRSTPDSDGWTFLIGVDKYELQQGEITDLACAKYSTRDTRKTLVIASPQKELIDIRRYAAYSWNKVYLLREVYDLDEVVDNLVRTNASFKGACAPK